MKELKKFTNPIRNSRDHYFKNLKLNIVYKFSKGEDFECSVLTFRNAAYNYASRNTLVIETHLSSDNDSIEIRFTKKESL